MTCDACGHVYALIWHSFERKVLKENKSFHIIFLTLLLCHSDICSNNTKLHLIFLFSSYYSKINSLLLVLGMLVRLTSLTCTGLMELRTTVLTIIQMLGVSRPDQLKKQ